MADFDVWNGKSRLALLIGIDKYLHASASELKGCVNDMESLAGVLGDLFDFAVVLMKDAEATRAAVLEAMQALLDNAREGDQIVLAWSGHGSTLSIAGKAPFETLVPFDSGRETWDDNKDITDRELFGWVWQVSEKTPYLTLIIDACQCGSVVRDFRPSARGAAGDHADNGWVLRNKNAFTDSVVSGLRAGKGKSGWLPASNRYTLLAACLASEKCSEIEDGKTGRRRGLFSLKLHQALCNLQHKLTWRDLFDGVATAVTLHNSHQHPQLEGNMDLAIFGQEIFKPKPFLPVLSLEGERAVLGGGAVHGVQLGSRWSLQAPGTRHIRSAGAGEATLGEVRIEAVEATRAAGRRRGGGRMAVEAAGLRAFETFRPVDSRYRVLLDSAAAGDKELINLLEKSPYLQLQPGKDGATGDVVLLRIPARAGCTADDPLPQVPQLEAESWAFVAPQSGAQLAPLHAAKASGHRLKVLHKLEQLARHAFLRRLSHPGERTPAHDTVEVEAYRLYDRPHGEKPQEIRLTKDSVIESGQRIAFRLTHRHSKSLQVYLFGLGLTGGIEMLFPVPGRYQPLLPGNVLEIGFHEADVLELVLPKNFPFAGETTEAVVKDHLLFIFSEKVAPGLELLVQEAFRGGPPHRAAGQIKPSSLFDLALGVAHGGDVMRHGSEVDALADQESWGLRRVELNFKV